MSEERDKYGAVEILVTANGYMVSTPNGRSEAFVRNQPISNRQTFVFEEFPALTEFLRTRLMDPFEKQ